MSLNTGRLTIIGNDGTERILKTSGKVFRIGSYLSCDFVLDNPDAKRVHCEIQSDSFGRITITNHSKRNPVLVDEVPLKGTRPLYTGSVVTIFEKKLRWINKNRVPRTENNVDQTKTPKKLIRRAEQAPNSEPSALMRKKAASHRITMHK
ncbi:unnamed protein product [Hermetia illucens]|uniref:FHA domain-containing protein n=1 Tax=Hermetia illucens TaxID=343691 RepID=A0A7R8V5Y0_HERIL|nr:unnamed protein product [Hermetia illucens]